MEPQTIYIAYRDVPNLASNLMSEFLNTACKFFENLDNLLSRDDRQSAEYSRLYEQRSQLLKKMRDERDHGNFFGALLIFNALHFLGFGIASPMDSDRVRKTYPFTKAELNKAFENNASKNLSLNWKPSDLDMIGPDALKGKKTKALWLGNDRVLKWYKAAGFADNTSFLQGAWPTIHNCNIETAKSMVKALLTEKTRNALKTDKEVLAFVKHKFVSGSKELESINERIVKLFDSENNNSLGLYVESISKDIGVPPDPITIEASSQVIKGKAKAITKSIPNSIKVPADPLEIEASSSQATRGKPKAPATKNVRTRPEIPQATCHATHMVGGGATIFQWINHKPIESVARFAAKDFELMKTIMKSPDKTYTIDNSIQPASPTGQALFKYKDRNRIMIVVNNNGTLSTHAYLKAREMVRDAELVTAMNVRIGSIK